jgi:hypothetical protein
MAQDIDQDAALLERSLVTPPAETPTTGVPNTGTPAAADDEDEGHDEVRGRTDEELDNAVTEEDREAIRTRRRNEKRDRAARRREREASQQRRLDELTAQNNQMQQQLAAINGNLASSQLNQHRSNLQQAKLAVQQYTAAYAAAVSAGDGDAAAQAMQNMQKAQRAELFFEQSVTSAQAQLNTPQRSATPGGSPTPQLNPNMVSKATAFMAKNKWYKGHLSTEPDSAVLTALDASLSKEGWDPATDEYWEELEARGKRYLPSRFTEAPAPKSGYNSSTGGRPQATSGSGGQSAGGRSTGDFSLSAQRVAAMKEAGHWDDPVKRKAMIDSYRAYDEQNRK